MIVVVGLLVLLIARLGWSVATTKTGGPFVVAFWTDGVRAAVGLPVSKVGEREPKEQAEYWLGRLKGFSTQDPTLLCGAAWVLDGPQPAYEKTKMRLVAAQRRDIFQGLIPPFEFDQEAVALAEAQFEQAVWYRRHELVTRAVELDPSDKEVWRARALMTFSGVRHSESWAPRTPHWKEVLEECRTHDPENALYDTIEALQDFRTSATFVFGTEFHTLLVHDPAGVEAARARVDRLRLSPSIQFAEEQTSYSWRFLETIGESPIGREDAVSGGQVPNRVVLLMRDLIRFQQALAGTAEQEGRFGEAKEILVHTLDIPTRLIQPEGKHGSYRRLSEMFSSVVVWTLLGLEEREPGTLTLEEYDRYMSLRAELKQREDDGQRSARAEAQPPPVAASLALTAVMALGTAAFTVLTLLVGATLLLVSMWLGRGKEPVPIPVASRGQIATACAVGWGLSVLLAVGVARALKLRPVHELELVDYMLGRGAASGGVLLGGALVWAAKSFERVAVGAALAISTAWTLIRFRRVTRGEVGFCGTRLDRIVACARDGGRLMLVMASLLVAIQLLLLPWMIDVTEATYRHWEGLMAGFRPG